jgi:hypothetical protein
MTLNRSSSRIVMVIVPVAFIAGAPKGADDQPTGQNTTFLFSGNATSELGTYNKKFAHCHYVNYVDHAPTCDPGSQGQPFTRHSFDLQQHS